MKSTGKHLWTRDEKDMLQTGNGGQLWLHPLLFCIFPKENFTQINPTLFKSWLFGVPIAEFSMVEFCHG